MFDATSYVDGKALIIDGTPGDDIVTVAYYNGQLRVKSTSLDSGEGFTTITGEVNAILFRGYEGKDQFDNATSLPLLAYGGRDNDIINVGDSARATVYGEQGNDILIGNDRANTLDGGIGNDTLMGLGGDDVLFGGPNDDKLFGYDGHDILFGGAGEDELVAGNGRDFLHGGLDYTRDNLLGNMSASSDGWRDTFIYEREASGVTDIDMKEDLGMYSDEDDEAVFRATGQLPGLGTSSSGYQIGDGVTFQFTAEDFGLSAVGIDWQNWIVDAEDAFANWTSASLDEIADLGSPWAANYVPPMLIADADLLEEPSVDAWTEEAAIVEDYFAEVAVDGHLLADDSLVEESPSTTIFDDYYESLAVSLLEPTIRATAYFAPSLSLAATSKAPRFSRW
jgi:Ca2+-binding RTX toxin-like protein